MTERDLIDRMVAAGWTWDPLRRVFTNPATGEQCSLQSALARLVTDADRQ